MAVPVRKYKRRRRGRRETVRQYSRRPVSHHGKRGYRAMGFTNETLEGLRLLVVSGLGAGGIFVETIFGPLIALVYGVTVTAGWVLGTKSGRRAVRKTRKRITRKATRAGRERMGFNPTGRKRVAKKAGSHARW